MDGIGGLMRECSGCSGSVQERRYSIPPSPSVLVNLSVFGAPSVEKIYRWDFIYESVCAVELVLAGIYLRFLFYLIDFLFIQINVTSLPFVNSQIWRLK